MQFFFFFFPPSPWQLLQGGFAHRGRSPSRSLGPFTQVPSRVRLRRYRLWIKILDGALNLSRSSATPVTRPGDGWRTIGDGGDAERSGDGGVAAEARKGDGEHNAVKNQGQGVGRLVHPLALPLFHARICF